MTPPLDLLPKTGSLASRRSLGRTRRPIAIRWAANGRYSPDSSRFRRTSLLTGEAARPSSRPIARRLAPARTRSPIRTRSCSDRNLADRDFVFVMATGA